MAKLPIPVFSDVKISTCSKYFYCWHSLRSWHYESGVGLINVAYVYTLIVLALVHHRIKCSVSKVEN